MENDFSLRDQTNEFESIETYISKNVFLFVFIVKNGNVLKSTLINLVKFSEKKKQKMKIKNKLLKPQ